MAIVTATSKDPSYKNRDALGRALGLERGTMPKRPTEDVIRENVAEIIAKYRDKKTFAKELKVSSALVTYWLQGKRNITLADLDKVADLAGVHPASFLIDKKDPDGAPIPDLLTALRRLEKLVKDG